MHGREVLLGLNCVRNLANVARGVVALELKCHDGQRLVVLTGNQLSPTPVRT
jgi:hypothetical protein